MHLQSDLSDRTLSLNLTIRKPEIVSLRSCDVLNRAFRNNVSFNTQRSIEEVLVSQLSSKIKSCLRSLPEGAHVLSFPDFLVEVPGLVLYGVQIITMEAKNGVRNTIFRFSEFLGGINNAFQEDIGFQEPFSNHTEKLAVSVLSEVCLPILNLTRIFVDFNSDMDRRRATSISDRAREFEFQTELLKRFIFNAGTGYAETPEDHLLHDTAKELA